MAVAIGVLGANPWPDAHCSGHNSELVIRAASECNAHNPGSQRFTSKPECESFSAAARF